MTLAQACTKLLTRFNVDRDDELGLSNYDAPTNGDFELLTSALMDAAEKVSEHSYLLWTSNCQLTLTACSTGASAGAEVDLLDTSVSALPLFHVYGISINGSWLVELLNSKFFREFPDYAVVAATATPSYFCKLAPSLVRFYAPPNATAVASSCFARGFYRHPRYTYANQSGTALLGPDEFHELVVDRAYLDSSKSYLSGDAALTRRKIIQDDYDSKTREYRERQLELYKRAERRDGCGRTRNMIWVGYS